VIPAHSRFARRPLRHWRERAIEGILFLAAFSAVATTIAIVAILVYESLGFFEHAPLWDFLTDTQWSILFAEKHYGILALISSTWE
jgi:phosphate transport system permease protein